MNTFNCVIKGLNINDLITLAELLSDTNFEIIHDNNNTQIFYEELSKLVLKKMIIC